MKFENRLKEYREKRKISQTKLASCAGVSQRYIAFIESGDRKPSLDVAFKLAKILKSSVNNIFLFY